jgi:tripartite-type tricarboxylate transporter receptor subunit TctC
LLALAPSTQAAQDYPEGQIKVISPYSPGGPGDMMGRILADGLQEDLGRTTVVESRGGAGGNTGSAEVARAAADGLTLLMGGETIVTVNPHVYKSLPYDPREDLEPIATVGSYALALSANASAGVKDVKELIALSKQRPIKFASGGIGSPGHLALERFKLATGIDAVHVPYKGGNPAAMALLSGEVDAGFLSIAVTAPNIESGKVVGLAVADPKRHALLPDVQTLAEQGVEDADTRLTYLIMAPKGLPSNVTETLEKVALKVFSSPKAKERLEGAGIDPTLMSREETQAWLDKQFYVWGKVAKSSGMTLD